MHELLISRIYGKSSDPQVYSVSELVESLKHWSRRQGWITYHELARFESIPHVQCLWACGHMEIASFDVFEWCVILVFGMFCFAEIAVSSDKSIIIRALGCARTHRLWVGNEANPLFPCRFAHILRLLVTTFLTDDYAFMSWLKVVSVVRSRPIIINQTFIV